jgi:hypothetical protein
VFIGRATQIEYFCEACGYQLWRVAHPYDPDVAVRFICWFPVVAELLAHAQPAGAGRNDKARLAPGASAGWTELVR